MLSTITKVLCRYGQDDKKSEVSHINVSKFFLKNMLIFTHVLKMKKIIAVISNEPKAVGVWFE